MTEAVDRPALDEVDAGQDAEERPGVRQVERAAQIRDAASKDASELAREGVDLLIAEIRRRIVTALDVGAQDSLRAACPVENGILVSYSAGASS